LTKTLWQTVTPVYVDAQASNGLIRASLSTTVRCLWSSNYLYLGYSCPFTKLTDFEPPQQEHKRYDLTNDAVSLWDRDVVEAFISGDAKNTHHYTEYEVAPSNERLDVSVNLPEKDFAWQSHFESAVTVNEKDKTWTCEMRIPMAAFGEETPVAGAKWRINLYRCDRANHASLAWNPPLQGTFHVPERFGILEFVE
jgi:hypothetical protein